MIFRCSVTILLNGSSMTTAPVVSKRPCRTTLVMPPGRSSAEMSMQHLSVGPSAPAQAVIAVFASRRNGETIPAQKISERFISRRGTVAVSAVASHHRPGRGFLLQCNSDDDGTPSGHAPAVLECHLTLIGTAR